MTDVSPPPGTERPTPPEDPATAPAVTGEHHAGRTSVPAIIAWILTLLAGAVLASQIFSYRSARQLLAESEVKLFKDASTQAVRQFDAAFKEVKSVADRFATQVETGQIGSDTLTSAMRQAVASNTFIRSFGVAYGEYQFASDTRLYARGFTQTGDTFTYNNIDASESYVEPTLRNSWFTTPMTQGPSWIEPYFDPIASTTIVEYSCPFYRTGPDGKKHAAGIVYADLSMEDVRTILAKIELGAGGYGMLLSKTGSYVTHPLEEYVIAMKPALEDPMVANDPMLKTAVEKALRGETTYVEFLNNLTKKPSMLYFQPVPTTGWPFGVVALKDFDKRSGDFVRQSMIQITLWSVMFLLLLFIAVINAVDRSEYKLWLMVGCFTFLVMTAMAVVWYLALNFTPYSNSEFVEVPDRPSLNRLQSALVARAAEMRQAQPKFLPTGFFIQSINFESANDVRLTGIIWQKFTDGVHDNVARGVEFPEAVDLTLTEKYKSREGNIEIIGWSFSTTLRQQFDYSRYPLDNKDVWLRAISADFGKNVVLVPDLESYPILNPTSLPGIEEDIVLSGWDLDSSFFNYVYNKYNTDFGLPDSSGKNVFPELYFTVIIKRNFLAPFVTYVLPILIIACILFTVLLMSTRDEKKNEMFQFSITSVIATCSGLFFSVLVAHSQLRGSVSVNSLMYLEYFCFVLYLAILGVACNAFMFGLDTSIRVVRERDNLIPKLMFWPLFMGLMLIVTVHTFY